jgi:8-amino-7-oxononanoate synthase
MPTLNFASSLYMGILHPSALLRPWPQLTLGAPAALAPPPGAKATARRLAALIGCERATLAPSTLHLFWDLFGVLATRPLTIYVDAGVYPIARWGVERAAARGARVQAVPHHDADALWWSLRRAQPHAGFPLVVADGYCPACGQLAPIAEYMAAVRAIGGLLVLDDTQALGILGGGARVEAPYGSGGGGSLDWSAAAGPEALVIASLAKGFGAPLAVLAGSHQAVGRFQKASETRVHCSPPPIASIRAAEHALAVNQARGDQLRARLLQLVQRFRARLAAAGLTCDGGYFPVQTIANITDAAARQIHRRLRSQGIETVLHCGHGRGARLSLIITALHRPAQIDQVAEALAQALQACPEDSGCGR